jgi:hypothetical protein
MNTDFITTSKNLQHFFDQYRILNINFNNLLKTIKNDELIMTKLLTLLGINIQLFKELLNIIKITYMGNDRQFKYCHEYTLILILYVKNNLNNWSMLQSLIICHNNYKVTYAQFLRWSKKGLFEQCYKVNVIKNIEFININEDESVLIDATSISNKYGSENVTMNPEYKKKNVTKLSVITTGNKFIIGVEKFLVNTKIITYNKQEKIIKTFEHDSRTIQTTVNKINNDIKFKNIVGDGGYKTQVPITLNKKIIKIITPNRKNQKNNLIEVDDKKKLKIRYRIENVFGSLKMNNERIMLRKDRKIHTFMSWFYIACVEHNLKIKTAQNKISKNINS